MKREISYWCLSDSMYTDILMMGQYQAIISANFLIFFYVFSLGMDGWMDGWMDTLKWFLSVAETLV